MIKKKIKFLMICVLFITTNVSAELWQPFDKFIDECDLIIRIEQLWRNDKLINERIAQIYWEKENIVKDFPNLKWEDWKSETEINIKTDKIINIFQFYGRKQSLWNVISSNNFFIYPGETARHTDKEFILSEIDFHRLLTKIGEYKKQSKKIILKELLIDDKSLEKFIIYKDVVIEGKFVGYPDFNSEAWKIDFANLPEYKKKVIKIDADGKFKILLSEIRKGDYNLQFGNDLSGHIKIKIDKKNINIGDIEHDK